MSTILPLSTVSYNTESFLQNVLNNLLENETIQFWWYIKHLPEGVDTKIHYHVYLEPAEKVDRAKLRHCFREYDPTNPELPMGTIPINITRDKSYWECYYYFLHDPLYLLSKGLTRKYHYNEEQIVTNDKIYFSEKKSMLVQPVNNYLSLGHLQEEGMTLGGYLISRNIPFNQIKYHENAWNVVQTERFNKKSSSPVEDEELTVYKQIEADENSLIEIS